MRYVWALLVVAVMGGSIMTGQISSDGPPDLRITPECTFEGGARFIIVNEGGPMTDELPYTVTINEEVITATLPRLNTAHLYIIPAGGTGDYGTFTLTLQGRTSHINCMYATARPTPFQSLTPSPTWSPSPTLTASPTFRPTTTVFATLPANTNLLDYRKWQFWNLETSGAFTSPFLTGSPGAGDASLYQPVLGPASPSTPLELTFTVFNPGSSPVSLALILRDASWSSARVCHFVIVSTHTFRMRTYGADWSSVMVQGWFAGTNIRVQLLDASFRYRPDLPPIPTGLQCESVIPEAYNLLTNRDFFHLEYGWTFENLVRGFSIAGGYTAVGRDAGSPYGVLYQTLPFTLPANSPLVLDMVIGGGGATFRTMNIMLRSSDWSEVYSCVVMTQDQALQYARMTVRTQTEWQQFLLQVWLLQDDPAQTVIFGNAWLEYDPMRTDIIGLTCPPPVLGYTPLSNGMEEGGPTPPADPTKAAGG